MAIIGMYTAPPLEPIFQQQAHKERLTPVQLEEAKKMGVKGLTTKNTQYDLLKLVKFKKPRLRHTCKVNKKLVKKYGRKEARWHKLYFNEKRDN